MAQSTITTTAENGQLSQRPLSWGPGGWRIGKTRTRALHELQYFSIRNYSVESNSIIFTRRATRLPTAFGRLPLSASVGRRTKGTPGSRTTLELHCQELANKSEQKMQAKMFANIFRLAPRPKVRKIYIFIYIFLLSFQFLFISLSLEMNYFAENGKSVADKVNSCVIIILSLLKNKEKKPVTDWLLVETLNPFKDQTEHRSES